MLRILLLPLLALFGLQASAQSDTDTLRTQNNRPYLAIITSMGGATSKGWLLHAGEDSVWLMPAKKKALGGMKYNPAPFALKSNANGEAIHNINYIAIRRKDAPQKGALYGFLAGAAIGAIAGLSEGDDPLMPYTGTLLGDLVAGVNNSFAMTAGEKAFAYGLAGGFTGAIAGALIGTLAKREISNWRWNGSVQCAA